MFTGYLTLDGEEILNGARAKKYVNTYLPTVEVNCDFTGLSTALGGAGYTSPAADAAPWYESTQAPTGRFYGFMPLGFSGAEDSTRELQLTELTGDGAVHSLPRYGSREIRVKSMAMAADAEALHDGLAWLKDTLENHCGGGGGMGCMDREAKMFASLPVSKTATQQLRTFYRVEVVDGLTVLNEVTSPRGWVGAEIEFVLRAGIPWAFTEPTAIATLNMDVSTVTQTDAAGEDCSAGTDPYFGFINDPYFTAMSKPPQPPNITPPNLTDLASWRRRTLAVPVAHTRRAGRAIPTITVAVGSNDLQQMRIRFYKTTGALTGCGYDGEYMISYLPVNSTLTIDGVRREITVLKSDGSTVPGGHLIYGTDGKPMSWASLDCHQDYTMTVDMMTGNTGVSVSLDIYVRD